MAPLGPRRRLGPREPAACGLAGERLSDAQRTGCFPAASGLSGERSAGTPAPGFPGKVHPKRKILAQKPSYHAKCCPVWISIAGWTARSARSPSSQGRHLLWRIQTGFPSWDTSAFVPKSPRFTALFGRAEGEANYLIAVSRTGRPEVCFRTVEGRAPRSWRVRKVAYTEADDEIVGPVLTARKGLPFLLFVCHWFP